MKKVLLLFSDNDNSKDLMCRIEGMGYSVNALDPSYMKGPCVPEIKGTDLVIYSYDEQAFTEISEDFKSLLNEFPVIFIVKDIGSEMLINMQKFNMSWYIKEPFYKAELDLVVDMASSFSSLKAVNDCPSIISSGASDEGKLSRRSYDSFSGTYTEKQQQDSQLLNKIYENAPLLMLIIDRNIIVEKINNVVVETVGRSPESLAGLRGGEIFSCIHSFDGEGCGTNPECSNCSIRNMVSETFRTGSGFYKVEGSMDILHDDIPVTHHFLITTIYIDSQDDGKVILYIDDITERKKAENTLKESEERFQTLYENVPGGTLIIGEDYIIEDVNQRTCEITGYKKEELIGQLCDIVCPKGSLSKKCPIWVEGMDGFKGMDTSIKCKDGSKTPILKNAKKTFIEGNQYILENFQDISQRKTAEETVINAKLAAEEANRSKSEFLATMSHELRTPLNAVIGYSDILLDDTFGVLNVQQRKSLEHISNSGKHLLDLINDILDLSKVESGKMEMHYEEFFVSEMFGAVLNIISPLACKKNINVEASIVPERLSLNGDRIRFKQILFNLASNAVKFTPEGGQVLLKAEMKGDVAEFSVMDTGIGISSEDLDKLFMPFQQIDSTMSRTYDGTGLGLSLVKRFVEMHGGEIYVETEPGKGSRFYFNIPLELATEQFT